jgi:hypothetical protein
MIRAFYVLQPDADEDSWCYWRFLRSLEAPEAFAAVWAVRKRGSAANYRELAEKIALPQWHYVQDMLAQAEASDAEAAALTDLATR